MYTPDFYENYNNAEYVNNFKNSILKHKNSGYFASSGGNRTSKENIKIWIKYNAAAICNYKYSYGKTADDIYYDIYHELEKMINNISEYDDGKLNQYKNDLLKTLSAKGVPPYLINTIKNSNVVDDAILKKFDKLKTRNDKTTETTTETTKNSNNSNDYDLELYKELYNKQVATSNFGYLIHPDALVDVSGNASDVFETEHILNELNFDQLRKYYIPTYVNRSKYVIYISSAHFKTLSGKQSHHNQIFEWKWSRMFGDLLQAALLKMGFTAIKVMPEDDAYSSKPDAVTGSVLEAKGADLSAAGRRAQIVNTILKTDINRCIAFCPHINAGNTKLIKPFVPGIKIGNDHPVCSRGFFTGTLRGIDICDVLSNCLLTTAKEEYKFYLECGFDMLKTRTVEPPSNKSSTPTIKTKEELKKEHDKKEMAEEAKKLADNVRIVKPQPVTPIRTIVEEADQYKYIPLDSTSKYIGHQFGYGEVSGFVTGAKMIPAVLTENLFQDAHPDINFLRSCKGLKELLGVHILGMFNFFTKRIKLKGKFNAVSQEANGEKVKVIQQLWKHSYGNAKDTGVYTATNNKVVTNANDLIINTSGKNMTADAAYKTFKSEMKDTLNSLKLSNTSNSKYVANILKNKFVDFGETSNNTYDTNNIIAGIVGLLKSDNITPITDMNVSEERSSLVAAAIRTKQEPYSTMVK